MPDFFSNLNNLLKRELVPSIKTIIEKSSNTVAETIVENLKNNNFFANEYADFNQKTNQSIFTNLETDDYEILNAKLENIKNNMDALINIYLKN
tara:strand:+ start:4627 stop:4908 length:282 start_codon:yes stop_codon:yes gene_type:complete